MMKSITGSGTLAAVLLGGALAAAPVPVLAQSAPLAMGESAARAEPGGAAGKARGGDRARELSRSLARGGYAVVIDVDENRLLFRQGDTVLWSAPIGTGTGLRLEADEQEWDFSTPNGVFHVQYKERDPVWIAPDWYFIENNLPVPPANDKKRYFPGGLGAAAVYIGHDLAIHGTDKPELLGQRVSHGCIRLENKDALRLFHNVQVGTEVVIVGGEKLEEERRAEAARQAARGNDPSTFSPGAKKPRPKDPVLERWKAMPTGELLWEMSEQLWLDADDTRWPEVAAMLVERGLDGDEDALVGMLRRVVDLPHGRVEREYQTYLADLFARGALRTLAVLSDLDRDERNRVARAIVDASMGLYGGEMDAPSAPWPTRRVPKTSIGREERLGWNAIERAERAYRDKGAQWGA